MEWDWKESAFTALKWVGAGLTTWGAMYVKGRVKPIAGNIKKFINLHNTVEELRKSIESGETERQLLSAKLSSLRIEYDKDLQIVKEKELAAFGISTTPVFKVDSNGDLFYVNGAWLDMVGSNNADEMYGRGYLRVIPQEDIPSMNAQTDWMIKHPTSFNGKIRYKHLHTDQIINTYCRTNIIEHEGKVVEIIGRLEILNTK